MKTSGGGGEHKKQHKALVKEEKNLRPNKNNECTKWAHMNPHALSCRNRCT